MVGRGGAPGGRGAHAGDAADAAPAPPARAALLALALGGGAASMVYQLGWTRTLVLAFGSSVHAFTLVVSVFILGIGLGGLLVPLARASGPRLLALLVAAEAAVGLAGWFATVQAGLLPLSVIEFVGSGVPDYGSLLRWEAARILGIALLPTAAMGAVFPLLIAALAPGRAGASRAVGRVYTVNTAGVIAGSLGGGMLLLPALGTRGALLCASSLNLLLAAAAALALLPRRRGLPAGALLLAAAAAAPFAAPSWPDHRIHCGPYLYARNYLTRVREDGLDLDRVLRNLHWDMPFTAEGRSLSAAVVRGPDGNFFLRVNGKTDASSVEDMDTQTMVGHLPVLLHPAPRRVMVVGLASGITAAAAASHGPETLDVAEISAEVRAAEREFRVINGDVTRRPFVHVLLEDGRTHIEHSSSLYDVVISEPTNPWIAGVSDLFTTEYFEAVKSRLAPGGIAAIWIQAYGLSRDDVRFLLRTFLSVFPGASVWEASPWQDYVVVGSRDGALDPAAALAARAWPDGNSEAAASLAGAGIRAREDLLGLLFLSPSAAAEWAGPGELHTDDRLQMEFRAPRRALSGEAGAFDPLEIDALRAAQPLPAGAGIDPARMAEVRRARALALEGVAALRPSPDGRAGAPLLRALMADRKRLDEVLPEVPKAAREAVAAALRGEDPGKGAEGSGEAVLLGLAVERGRAAYAAGQRELWAVDGLAEALLLRGRRSLLDGAGRDAAQDFLGAGRLQFWNAMAPYLESFALYKLAGASGDKALLGKSLDLVDLALLKNPRCEPALVHRGMVLDRLGRRGEAKAALLAALEIRPDSVMAMGSLGVIALAEGNAAEAREWVARGLALEPGNRDLLLLDVRAERGR